MAGTSQPQEVHTGAIDDNEGFVVRPNSSAPPTIAVTNTDGAPPNVVDSTPGFVTMVDLTALLDRERSKQGTVPFQFVHDLPYLKEILSKPYRKKYESPAFSQYDGRKGNVMEYVSKFLDAMGAHGGDRDLCLCEFSKSLSDRAYTWYTTLLLGSIYSWDEMVEQFCKAQSVVEMPDQQEEQHDDPEPIFQDDDPPATQSTQLDPILYKPIQHTDGTISAINVKIEDVDYNREIEEDDREEEEFEDYYTSEKENIEYIFESDSSD
ncbi:hypothetical protein SLA2020_056300 [Shorea laevis]